jgi:hypothetical protein
MILIGSQALAAHGLREPGQVKDLDVIGTFDEVALLRGWLGERVQREREEHGHRQVFYLRAGEPWQRVEIDHEQSPSDQMLPGLCTRTTSELLGGPVQVPPVEVLYLIKRAHANVPVHYDKTIRDLIDLKPRLGEFSPAQLDFYHQRKRECQERYQLQRQRFSLSIRNEDFFDLSNHVRLYEHDDLHEAVAHTPGQPLYKRCKRDLTLAKIDTDLFEQLSMQDRLRMVQEEFMVIGVERFYLSDRSLPREEVYRRGMHKTIRDLFVGYFQDFCIDHADRLLVPPAHDFVAAFEAALREGRVREVQIVVPPPTDAHKAVWQLIQRGELAEARRRAEDMVRRGDAVGDSHAFFLLGAALLRSKQLAPAEKCLRRCVTRDRKNAAAWFHLGWLYRLAGRHELAIRHLRQAEQLGLRQFGLYLNLGLTLEGAGQAPAASAAYRQALHYKPDAPLVKQRLAALEAQAGGPPGVSGPPPARAGR